jgi:hypothetical protein
MDDRLSRVESHLHDLERSLALVERRLTALEGAPTGAAGAMAAGSDAEGLALPRYEAAPTITLIGRTFVALGGAYLLRALTDSAVLPHPLGVASGLLYAIGWIAAADRDGGRGRPLSAAFHALVGAMVAFPLVWEMVVRFEDLSPAAGALLLSAVALLGIGVAVHRRLQSIAWIVTSASVPAAIAVIGATGAIAPFAVFLIALGVVTLWLGYSCQWLWLRWPAAFAADVAVIALTISGASRHPSAGPATVLTVQMLLLNAYLASIVVRTIFRARDVILFEIVQALAALAVGFGGAVYIAGQTGRGAALLALINLAFGIGCYAVALAFMRQGRPRNFHFYSSLALVLVVASAALLLAPAELGLFGAALAVVAAWTARRIVQPVLTIHAIAYLVVAGIGSGGWAAAARALAAPVGGPWPAFGPVAIFVVTACAICWAIAPRVAHASMGISPTRLALTLLLVVGVAGAMVSTLGWLLYPRDGTPIDAGVVATVRTAVLAAAAVALAWAGQRDRFRESRWLVYPVLAAAGIKMLLEDLPRSKPETLFAALAVYGLALIAASRVAHRRPA